MKSGLLETLTLLDYPYTTAKRAPGEPEMKDWSKQRQTPSPYDLFLNRASQAWMSEIPAEYRPEECGRQFPRIINRIANYWDSPRMLDAIFEDLLVDKRGGRRGFPHPVLVEIVRLHEYHRKLHGGAAPEPHDLWDDEPDRR